MEFNMCKLGNSDLLSTANHERSLTVAENVILSWKIASYEKQREENLSDIIYAEASGVVYRILLCVRKSYEQPTTGSYKTWQLFPNPPNINRADSRNLDLETIWREGRKINILAKVGVMPLHKNEVHLLYVWLLRKSCVIYCNRFGSS